MKTEKTHEQIVEAHLKTISDNSTFQTIITIIAIVGGILGAVLALR